jgi:arylsulfatase A-like enzyme
MPWPARRPNIVLIVLDTLRARSLSCYGYGRRTSPCLDAFAAQSVRYTRCTASSSWSLPSHAEILTGSLFPATFPGGADHPELSDGVTTLSEAMAQVGYATAGIAANFVVLGGRYNLEQGFQYFDARPAAGYRRLSLPTLRHRLEDRASLQVLAQAIVKGPSPFLYAEEVTARALSWITEQRPRGRPYFLFLNYLDAHATMRHRWGTLSFSEQTALMEGRRSPSYEERQHLTAAYDEAVSYLDQHVGRLLRFLLETAEAEDTWIIVTSDHGESIGEHGGVGHRADDLHQEVLHVPLLVKYPAPRAEERGKVDDRPVQLVDVLPTILDRLDLPRPAGLEGRPISERRDAMFALGGEAAAVIGGDLKYVERASGLPELFDLRDDPAEVRNLVEDRPREAAALRERLRTWRFSRRTVAVTRTMPSPEPRLLKSLGYAQ